jgi:RNA polymerase sigma-70 factor, ECF subfamily
VGESVDWGRPLEGSSRRGSEAKARGTRVTERPLSFEAFFAAEAPALFRRLCVIAGNSAEAEEIMQDAFLALWERWDRVASMDDPTGYLYRTALNVFRSRFRRATLAVRKAVSRAPALEPFAEVDLHQDLVKALAELTPRQRAALVLTDGLDYSSEEAAEAMGVAPGTVRGMASRARAAIRPKVDELT